MRNSIHAEGISPYKFEISKALLNGLKLKMWLKAKFSDEEFDSHYSPFQLTSAGGVPSMLKRKF